MNQAYGKPRVLAALLAGLLSACAGTGGAPVPGSDQPVAPATGPEAVVESDPEVMHKVWSAELHGAEGDLNAAARDYLAAALQSQDPEIARRAVETAVSAQAWQFAAMAADRWVVLAPDDLEARETAVRTQLLGGDYVQAEYQLDGLLTQLADTPWGGWDRVARLLAASHDASRADRLVQNLAARRAAARNPYALLARSQAAARGGMMERAVALADDAIAKGPGEVDPLVWAGRLALTRRDQAAALDYYRAAWSLRPADTQLASAYAQLLRRAGAGNEAQAVLAGLPDTPENRFARIALALEVGEAEEALSLYDGFDDLEAADPAVRAFEAARAAELLGRPEEAIEWYAVLVGTERELLAQIRRAVLSAELGRMDEARAILLAARNHGNASEQLETYLVEAQLLMDRNGEEQALAVLGQALEQFPGETRLLYARALAAVAMDRIDLAERDLRTVLDAEPDNATALNALGYTLADRTDRLQEAEALIGAAHELEPDEPAILDSMGWVAYRLGRLEEAETYLRQAFLRERNAEIAAHLGEVLWVQGRQRDAVAVWEQAYRIDPGDRVLLETLQRFGVEL